MVDVITGEAVALELPVANFPSRIAALLIDMAVQIVLLLVVLITLMTASGQGNGDYVAAGLVTANVLVLIAYPTAFETLSRGKTLGKMALGIRVVGDDGSPVRFRQALVRALVGVLEIWTLVLAPVGLITSIISVRGKRVGDMFAGTYVIQERVPVRHALPPIFAAVPAPLAAWAQTLQVSRLSDQTAEAAGSYLRRFAELSPLARDSLGAQLANAVAAQVSPPPPVGTPPTAYLAAVLAVRRERDQARFAAQQATPPQHAQPQHAPPQHAPPQHAPPAPAPPAPPPPAPTATLPAHTVSADAVPADTVRAAAVRPPELSPPGFAPPG
jgi:uncharacterized RDD family membrane protein YckC